MNWYVRPESCAVQLEHEPRLASWNRAADPDQRKLTEFLDHAVGALPSVDGPFAVRLDVGLPPSVDLLRDHDLDNYAYPLAVRVAAAAPRRLVSFWCTKRHSAPSLLRVSPAVPAEAPTAAGFSAVVRTTASATGTDYKREIQSQLGEVPELTEGPVSLQLAFAGGATRNWLNLWKPTIDALDPLLGRTWPHREWNPRDGRIVELGLHNTIDPSLGNAVRIAVAASSA